MLQAQHRCTNQVLTFTAASLGSSGSTCFLVGVHLTSLGNYSSQTVINMAGSPAPAAIAIGKEEWSQSTAKFIPSPRIQNQCHPSHHHLWWLLSAYLCQGYARTLYSMFCWTFMTNLQGGMIAFPLNRCRGQGCAAPHKHQVQKPCLVSIPPIHLPDSHFLNCGKQLISDFMKWLLWSQTF
jgi:hypothetical protein